LYIEKLKKDRKGDMDGIKIEFLKALVKELGIKYQMDIKSLDKVWNTFEIQYYTLTVTRFNEKYVLIVLGSILFFLGIFIVLLRIQVQRTTRKLKE